MINKWYWIGIVLVFTSILGTLFVIFPRAIISGTDTEIGPIQFILIMLGLVTALLGFRIAQNVAKAGELKVILKRFAVVFILCLLVLVLNLISVRVYIPGRWREQIRTLRWVIDWLVLVLAIYKLFFSLNKKIIWNAAVRIIRTSLIFIQSNYWIAMASVIIVICLFSDIFMGAVWVYTLFFAMGFGFSLWLISPEKWLVFAPAFAPIIGYAIVSVVGSWLVMLDFPVKTWAVSYTIVAVLLNLLFVLAWIKKNSSWQKQIIWRTVLNDLSIGYFAVILVVLPVVIGGMKFSIFRGNQDDAHNYMAMAYYLAGVRFSLHQNLEMLFQLNPAHYLGGGLLATRWSSSMLMAYSSMIAGIPIYRFDFAFSALPFTLLMTPIYKTLKEIGLDIRSLFFLAIGISAGYYGQVVLDSRAVSYCTSLPVVLAFVSLLARIWDDKDNIFKGFPIYLGEILLLTIFTLALFVLYPEILSILGLGVFIGALYYVLYKSVQVKKTIILFLSAASSTLIIYITLPIYIKFLVQQISGSQNTYVTWHTHFFSWIFNDFPSGLWGLNLYQINGALSPVFQVYAYILTGILIIAWFALSFRRAQTNTVVQMSGFIMTAGAVLFAYMYFRGQYWQAGKMFTYVYPFTMIFVAFIPHEIKNLKIPNFPAVFHPIIQALILFWLVLFAGTSIYRFVIVTRGMTYPFYLGGTGYGSAEVYHSIYNWETGRFLNILKKPGNVVWLSSDTSYQDMIWALSMPFDVKTFNAHPVIGGVSFTVDESLMYLPGNLPDYLIVSNNIWRWNDGRVSIPPVLLSDPQFSLIQLFRQLPDVPLLVGIRNYPIWSYPDGRNLWVDQESWLVFLSPTKCEAILSGDGLTIDKYPSLDIVIDSKPLNSESIISFVDKQPFQFLVPLDKGYNLVSIKISKEFLEKSQPGAHNASFQNMRVNYTCNTK